MIQFDEHIYQMGWFNHQLAKVRSDFPTLLELPSSTQTAWNLKKKTVEISMSNSQMHHFLKVILASLSCQFLGFACDIFSGDVFFFGRRNKRCKL